MIHIKDLKSGLPIYKALSSEIRIDILEMIKENKSLNLNEIAARLGLTNGAVTMHIKKLEESGLIEITNMVGKHGIQKICYLHEDILTIELQASGNVNVYEVEIRVGHYSDYAAEPTCGLATKNSIIGEFDDSRYFADPQHIDAGIIWLAKGYLEYRIPNYLKNNQRFKELQFILELSSEAPGYNNQYPSDIEFSINHTSLGSWTSPGDFGGERGLCNPEWWPPHLNQFGMLKLLRINDEGTFIDGCRISDTTLGEIGLSQTSDIKFRIAVSETAKTGGLTLFGRHFGHYGQDIISRIIYDVVDG